MNRRLFKSQRFLLLLLVGVLLGMGTASLLPHGHEGDWDHRQHPNCPLYRLAAQTLNLPSVFALLFLGLVFVERFFSASSAWVSETHFPTLLTRAPPRQ